jgi:CRP-like cAMP-binding protein
MPKAPVSAAVDENFALFLSRILSLEDFFPEFTAAHLAKVFPRSGLYVYPDGWRLIEQGERGRDMFIVYTGCVAIHKALGSAVAEVARLEAGSILGEIALLQDGIRVATAVVVGESRIFRLAFEDMPYLLRHHPRLEAHLRALANRRLAD